MLCTCYEQIQFWHWLLIRSNFETTCTDLLLSGRSEVVCTKCFSVSLTTCLDSSSCSGADYFAFTRAAFSFCTPVFFRFLSARITERNRHKIGGSSGLHLPAIFSPFPFNGEQERQALSSSAQSFVSAEGIYAVEHQGHQSQNEEWAAVAWHQSMHGIVQKWADWDTQCGFNFILNSCVLSPSGFPQSWDQDIQALHCLVQICNSY